MLNNSAVDCSLLLKFGIEFGHVTSDLQQTFKINGRRSRLQLTCDLIWSDRQIIASVGCQMQRLTTWVSNAEDMKAHLKVAKTPTGTRWLIPSSYAYCLLWSPNSQYQRNQ